MQFSYEKKITSIATFGKSEHFYCIVIVVGISIINIIIISSGESKSF